VYVVHMSQPRDYNYDLHARSIIQPAKYVGTYQIDTIMLRAVWRKNTSRFLYGVGT